MSHIPCNMMLSCQHRSMSAKNFSERVRTTNKKNQNEKKEILQEEDRFRSNKINLPGFTRENNI